ncbi:MAG: hypothetical protein DIU78_011095 [Pseudomonadota bacterium]
MRIRLGILGLCCVLALPIALPACGGGQPEVKHANVQPGPMPEGGEWRGVYYSPLYGYLHLEADDRAANGAWRTASGDAYGELSGEIDGDLLRFTWTERIIGAVGANVARKGKGYFKYSVPKAGEAHVIKGERGHGESDVGELWEAVKQINMQPNPASVRPDEIEGRVTGAGGWDEGEEGATEGGEGDSSGSSDGL